VIDLEDSVLRRKRGENAYFSALKSDLLPRVTSGQLASIPRREQKIRLAKILFSDEEDDEKAITEDGGANTTSSPSEVYQERDNDVVDEETKKKRLERLSNAKFALKLSSVLREAACASLALSEISKRYLAAFGKLKAEDALRCAVKAVEIASDGFYDNDEVALEVSDRERMFV
jgi:hypothetical protein